MSLEAAYNTIEKLVEDFKANEKHYLSPSYSESQVRIDFIDKFLIALGWDVNHDIQKNPYEQEVKVERGVDIGDARKRADYSFAIAPNYRDTVFFVEAKKPSKNLYNPNDYFQAIRYGWNAENPIVVLTDFEELHIIDSRSKPNIKNIKFSLDKKLKSYHYTDYTNKEKFQEIYYLFSREAVAENSLTKYAETLPKPKGKAFQKGLFAGAYKSLDDAFLEELDEIRNTLARAFKKSNPTLDSEALTEATQRVIDRIVFIRFLEDKLIEGETHIDKYGEKSPSAWQDFINDSRQLNAKYNGVVFKEHFIDRMKSHSLEKGGYPQRAGVLNAPDDNVFKTICEDISITNSPYLFNYFPIHILGSIYERFLGKIVVATAKQVRIEEKPEVRKAGGVYYTPQYIVQYIVENTVGKLIEGKTPKEITKLSFADISCGSGSFLITVYDTVLQYIAKWYQQNPAEAEKAGCILKNGQWVLSLNQKKEILLNNVFGVDIDNQAVEVTQLSLFLKLLEDESLASIQQGELFTKAKVLPDLSKNIVCGNSLIGTDINTGNMFPSEEEKRINAMNFEDRFPEIMKRGGFDAIVGNPPYRMIQPHNTPNEILNYVRNNYEVSTFKIDLFHLFINKSVRCLNLKGMFGYIIPTTILNNVYAAKLRKWLLHNSELKILATTKEKVFINADVYTSVLILKKEIAKKTIENNLIQTSFELNNLKNNLQLVYSVIKQDRFLKSEGYVWNILLNEFNFPVINKLITGSNKLIDIAFINRGLITGDRDKYFANTQINDKYVPILAGSDVLRYYSLTPKEYVYFVKPKTAGGSWDREMHLAQHKIIIRQIGTEPTATIINEPIAVTGNIFTIRDKKGIIDNEKIVLGIINSNIVKFFWKIMFSDFKASFPQVTISSLEQIPIIDLDSIPKNIKQQFVKNIDDLLVTKLMHYHAKTDKDKTFYENKTNSLDRQIDRLVYELYGLTEEEIMIVEGE